MVAAVINQEDVNRVCNDLSSAGKNVNISTVFKELGRGGPNTIKKYISCWREETADGNTEIAVIDNDLPDDYKNQVMAMGKALFNAAEKEMQATVTRINAEKEEAIAKAEDELKEVSDVAEQLNSKNIELQEQLQEQLEITSKLKKEKAIGDTKLQARHPTGSVARTSESEEPLVFRHNYPAKAINCL
jgi:transposase-like protein